MTWTETSSPTRRAAGRAGVGGGLHGADIATDHHGDVAGADVFLAGEHDVRGLDHRVGRFDRADQPLVSTRPRASDIWMLAVWRIPVVMRDVRLVRCGASGAEHEAEG